MIKNGPTEGAKNLPTIIQNGETQGDAKEGEGRRQNDGTTPGKQINEENKK